MHAQVNLSNPPKGYVKIFFLQFLSPFYENFRIKFSLKIALNIRKYLTRELKLITRNIDFAKHNWISFQPGKNNNNNKKNLICQSSSFGHTGREFSYFQQNLYFFWFKCKNIKNEKVFKKVQKVIFTHPLCYPAWN